ncbi:MAG: 23S rRNA (guanosine(2251)-2'-O)-methyltransferase RlmB [Bacteroidales bacterium]|nr:23S rRNA (guanosine(2251)-2'-O)-methyltransferase RlmB [Bacteroidales bacterium]
MKKEEFIYGIHPILEALRSGREVEKIVVSSALRGQNVAELRTEAERLSVPMQHVPNDWFRKMGNVNHQGAMCYMSAIEYTSIEQMLPMIYERGEVPFLLMLDRITDVRNFGAIVRTAECAGVHAIIVPSRGHALICGDAVKTSAGALNRMPICREYNLKETIKFLKDSGIAVVSASEKFNNFYNDVDMTTPVAIIMGSEEDGVSPEYVKLSNTTVKIPMYGEINSLNVSVATGIMLFEVTRQRRNLNLI